MTTPAGDGMLRIADLAVYYGGIQALKEVSLHWSRASCWRIIGANGAGKTTLLRTMSGVLRARSGSIGYEGREMTRVSPYDMVGLGIAQSPEGRQLFGRLTVLENLKLGAVQRTDRAAIARDLERRLRPVPGTQGAPQPARGTLLSGGEQQMLAIEQGADEPGRGCCCSTNRRSGWRRCWWTDLWRDLAAESGAASPFCWWSRTRAWPWRWRTAHYVMETGEIS